MPDWLKILMGALAGLATGLIAEPVKTALQDEIKLRRMERLLAEEMCSLVQSAGRSEQERAFWSWDDYFSIERYEFYYANQRELFYRQRHYHQIDSFYREMKMAKAQSATDEKMAGFYADGAITSFAELLSKSGIRPAFRRLKANQKLKEVFAVVHERIW